MGTPKVSQRARPGEGPRRKQSLAYYIAHRDEILRKSRETAKNETPTARRERLDRLFQARQLRKDEIKEQQARYRSRHLTEIKARARARAQRLDPTKKAEIAASKARWYQDNKATVREYKRAWSLKNEGRRRDGELCRLYGIGLAEYSTLLGRQNGGCGICGGQPNGRWRRWFHVDHDHVSGRIRGLLCSNCNLGLGKFQDDPVRLLKAHAYLLA